MKDNKKADYRSRLTAKQIFTIPNILSFVRIGLIPLIVWLYVGANNYNAAFIVIYSSSLPKLITNNWIPFKYKFIVPVPNTVIDGLDI